MIKEVYYDGKRIEEIETPFGTLKLINIEQEKEVTNFLVHKEIIKLPEEVQVNYKLGNQIISFDIPNTKFEMILKEEQ